MVDYGYPQLWRVTKMIIKLIITEYVHTLIMLCFLHACVCTFPEGYVYYVLQWLCCTKKFIEGYVALTLVGHGWVPLISLVDYKIIMDNFH